MSESAVAFKYIGISIVELIRREENILHLEGVDILDENISRLYFLFHSPGPERSQNGVGRSCRS